MGKSFALLSLALVLPGLARGGEAPRVVKVLLRGPHSPTGVPAEVLLPHGWVPGQPALLMVFLHDGWGTQRSFRVHGLAAIADALMRAGAIPAAVIASPRHRGTFLVDSPRAEMESFVADDLVPVLEQTFPGAGGSRARRSVWGISLGGYGALKMALRHPEVFGRVAALAPWVQPLAWSEYEKHRTWWSRRLLEPVFGRTREESRFEVNDLYRIAESADPERVPPIYVRTGSKDRWEAGAQRLVVLLGERGIAVDDASIPGARHGWSDWRAAAAGVLEFLTR
jgi:enterochelin esterase-like enzyme